MPSQRVNLAQNEKKSAESMSISEQKRLIEANIKLLDDSKNKIPKNLKSTKQKNKFFNLCEILKKFFLNNSIQQGDLDLKSHEMGILKNLLLKKGYQFKEDLTLTGDILNDLRSYKIKKLKEYNIKFILIKAVKHLQNKFVTMSMKSGTNNFLKQAKILRNKDFYFYQYYFLEVSKKKKVPIESFYAFKNFTHRYNSNIPKTITRKSLELWKCSPKFIKGINEYLNGEFLEDFKVFNTKKINRLTNEWSKKVGKEGLNKGVESINRYLTSKGCKLPWTMNEVKNAIKDTLESINS